MNAKNIKQRWANIWAASEVYAFCLVGSLLSVFLDIKTATMTVANFSAGRLSGAFGIAAVITAAMESVGTKEGKRRNVARRGALAVLLGFFWEVTFQVIQNRLSEGGI